MPSPNTASDSASSVLQAAGHADTVQSVSLGTTPNAATVGLSDDFAKDTVGGSASGWSVATGTWSICQTGTVHAYCQTGPGQAWDSVALNGAASWADYTVQGEITNTNATYGGAGIIGRAASPSRYYVLELRPNGSQPYWFLQKKSDGKIVTLGSGPLNAPDKGTQFGLRLTFAGSRIDAAIAFDGGTNYKTLGTVTDSSFATGQVGFYTWKSQSQSFQSILVTLAGAAMPIESAVSSTTFLDSIGMDAQFQDHSYSNRALEQSLVGNLGIKHYRVAAGLIQTAGGAYTSNLTTLNSRYGTKFDVLVSRHLTPAQVVSAIALLPTGSVDTVEGPNENDSPSQGIEYDPNFAVDVPAYMKALYTTIKSTPATSGLGVIGPSFANFTSYGLIGNIAAYVDYGNMHDYMSGFNPGTAGWGGGGYSFAPGLLYGAINWNIAASAQATGTKPVMATETGYATAHIHCGIPFDVQAKYIPRLYLESFRRKVPRTFTYQLIGDSTTTNAGSLYIVGPTGVPTPAYRALQGLIAALNDGGTKSSPVNFGWFLSGQVANIDHVLLRKGDGTIIIPLWIEVPSFDPNANGGVGVELTVPEQSVSVNVPSNLHNALIMTGNPATGAWTQQSVTIANGSFTMNVSDMVSILEIKPS